MANIFSIGQSALTVAQAGVNTAGHNIANAATPGYNRQTVVQVAGQTGAQATANEGMGVQVAEVKRNYSSFLGTQLLSMTSCTYDTGRVTFSVYLVCQAAIKASDMAMFKRANTMAVAPKSAWRDLSRSFVK